MAACRVLGPLVIEVAGGKDLVLASAAQRRLLSAVCIHPWTVMRSSVLERSLDLTPGGLRTSVSRLRKIIGGDTLASAPGGYQLRADVDSVEFERLVQRGLAGIGQAARSDLDAAITLWRGVPYEEFADEAWAHVEVQRLTELHAAAVEARIAWLLEAGDHAWAITQLHPLIAAHPYRDRPRGLLMRGLAQAGRRTDALREFQAYRMLLLDDIGTEPGAEIVALDRSIAADAAPPMVRHNLPAEVSSFVGRVSEAVEVADLIRRHRLVTLTGSGGCGKTRLALHVAAGAVDDRFDDIWWVNLTLISDGSEMAEHVARVVDAGPDPARGLLERLGGGRSTLLVLDNAEHVVDATVELLDRLLSACPNLRIMTTSRQVLRAEGELIWHVPSLSLPPPGVALTFEGLAEFDAVTLFLERVRSGRPGLVVDRDVLSHIETICTSVDGLPLAIELAAAQVRTSPISEVARAIAGITNWPRLQRGSTSPRHATLRASIAWSFDLLTDADRPVLARLAAFRSSFTREAALAVAASSDDLAAVAATLDRFVDASLLQLDEGSERYRMLETVKQFCGDLELEVAERLSVRVAHAKYFAAWCTEVGEGLRGIGGKRFSLEMPDVVEALAWARPNAPELALQICVGLGSLWSALASTAATTATWEWLMSFDRRGVADGEWAAAVAALMSWATSQSLVIEGLSEKVMSLLPDDSLRARGWIERGAAMIPAYSGQMKPILSYVRGALERGDDAELSIYGGFASYMLALVGRLDESERWLRELRRLTRRHHTAFAVETIGNGYAAAIVADALRGDLANATRRGECDVPTGSVFALTAAVALAQVALSTGDSDSMERALRWSRRATIPILAYTAPLIGCASSLLDDDIGRAADLAEDFIELGPQVPVAFVQGWPMCIAASLAASREPVARGATEIAARLVKRMEPAPFAKGTIHACRAQLAAYRGDFEVVDQQARRLLTIARADGFELLVIDALELIASAAANRGETAIVETIIGATTTRRGDLGYRYRNPWLPPVPTDGVPDRIDIVAAIELVRTSAPSPGRDGDTEM
ncbi:MAG: BTAD domain-containing putative transcriptional regulator [Ilumatobacteraceae bacterium]